MPVLNYFIHQVKKTTLKDISKRSTTEPLVGPGVSCSVWHGVRGQCPTKGKVLGFFGILWSTAEHCLKQETEPQAAQRGAHRKKTSGLCGGSSPRRRSGRERQPSIPSMSHSQLNTHLAILFTKLRSLQQGHNKPKHRMFRDVR